MSAPPPPLPLPVALLVSERGTHAAASSLTGSPWCCAGLGPVPAMLGLFTLRPAVLKVRGGRRGRGPFVCALAIHSHSIASRGEEKKEEKEEAAFVHGL